MFYAGHGLARSASFIATRSASLTVVTSNPTRPRAVAMSAASFSPGWSSRPMWA